MELNVVEYNNPILYKECNEFDFSNPPINPEELALSLVKKMNELGALGLSANQVGLPYKVFAIAGDPYYVCFNARIVQPSEETILMDEGCVSFPGLIMKIERPRHIRCRFQGPDGDTYTKTFTGMTARVFQHELLHGKGKIFFEGASKPKLKLALTKAKKVGYNYNLIEIGKLKNENTL